MGNRKRRFAYKKKKRNQQKTTSVFTIHLESCSREDRQDLKKGKLHIVDMAALQPHPTLKVSYNVSNYALKNVANALIFGNPHTQVPYHDSKVTLLLR